MKNQLKEKENLFCVKKTIIIIVSVIFVIAAILVYERNFSGRRKSNVFSVGCILDQRRTVVGVTGMRKNSR